MNQRVSTNQHSELVNAEEAASILKVKVSTVYAYASRGLLGGSTRGPGKKARYPRSLVERLKVRSGARAGHRAVASGALRWGEPVLDTSITEITAAGPVYRGVRAIDFVKRGATLEQVAAHLWKVDDAFTEVDLRLTPTQFNGDSGVYFRLMDLVMHLGSQDPARFSRTDDSLIRQAERVAASIACSAGPHGKAAQKMRSLAEALAASWTGKPPKPSELALVNAALVLMADHELNASTFTARIAASGGADVYACIAAALATLSGPLHGGACDRGDALWTECVSAASASQVVSARLSRGEILPGFGVGAYPMGDPRAQALLDLLFRSGLNASDLKRVHDIRTAAATASGSLPEIDFALVALTRVLKWPVGSASSLFALGRSVGWVAHIREQRASKAFIRPRARYVQEH